MPLIRPDDFGGVFTESGLILTSQLNLYLKSGVLLLCDQIQNATGIHFIQSNGISTFIGCPVDLWAFLNNTITVRSDDWVGFVTFPPNDLYFLNSLHAPTGGPMLQISNMSFVDSINSSYYNVVQNL